MLLNVKLYPEVSSLSRENPPVASFVLRVVSSTGERKAFTHPGKDKILLCSCSTTKDEFKNIVSLMLQK